MYQFDFIDVNPGLYGEFETKDLMFVRKIFCCLDQAFLKGKIVPYMSLSQLFIVRVLYWFIGLCKILYKDREIKGRDHCSLTYP